ncbi:MAG TPA: choice-of-anchor Q domain-containing protein, partial [Patescibacteria group bacterium]|nr:choice-of-anchor Q domain-containing protein [Patescibacteria group bacterium]
IAGEIYIGTGDSAVQTGIIKWDVATGVWSDNKTLTELGSISGFTSLVGAMKYKGLDLLFSGNYIMTFADDSTASESGIWRCTKDLNPANYTSVDTQILSFPNRAGWTGLKTSSGNLIFADQLGTTATDRQINIYSSSDGGNTWTIVGKYGVIAGTVSYLNVMELNGKIYLSEPGGGSAGKGAGGTAIVSEQGAYSEEFPVVLAPVYWVAANGADNTTNGRGWYSNLPWASAKYALLSDKMTYGGRLIIGSGSYNAAAVAQADWNGNAKAGTGITVIEGAGEALTTITRSAGATNSQVFWFDNTTGDVLLKSMWLYTNITGSQELVVDTNGTYTAPATLYMRDMRVGNKDVAGNNATSQLRVARKADIKRCTFEVDPATNSVGLILVLSGKTYAGLNISNSILKYGSPALSIKDIQAGYPPVIYNNVFDGAENFGVWIEANTGAEQPLIKNNIFINTGTNSLKDSASISETGVDYNIYDKALSAVTDGGHSLAIGVDPLFIDAANGNFRLQLSSPAIDHGTSVGLTSDFLGTVVPQGSAPDMGAYEYDATAPTLSGASSIGHTNDTTPNFTFTTDEAGTINYSGDCSSTTTSAVVGSNTITFSALSEGVHSNCLLTITDPAGNESDSLEITTFTIDTTAPDVSNTDENTDDDLNIHNVKAESTENTITITWKTDHNTKSTVKYGISKNLKEKKKDNDKEKKHEVILKNLLPNTKYYFRINATDSDDNEDSSSIHLIMTKAAQISNLSSRQSSSGNTNQTTAENTATPSYSGTSTPNICSYTVESGDTLWSIAKKVYSDATACTLIIDKNKDKYPNIESKLAIGQELTFGCENNQLKNTGNNSNIDNSSQQTQPQPETKTSHWYNPFSWF